MRRRVALLAPLLWLATGGGDALSPRISISSFHFAGGRLAARSEELA